MSKSFHPIFIKLGGHNISTTFYNLPNPPRHSCIMALELSKNGPKLWFPLAKSNGLCRNLRSLSNVVNMLVGIISRPSSITCHIPLGTPALWQLNCPKLWFLLSKSKSLRPFLIKLGEYVGRPNISTKFYNQVNSLCTPELWPLNSPK